MFTLSINILDLALEEWIRLGRKADNIAVVIIIMKPITVNNIHPDSMPHLQPTAPKRQKLVPNLIIL